MIDVQSLTIAMAHAQARYLQEQAADGQPTQVVAQVVSLIEDCVEHLNLPALAVELALDLHTLIERWTAWTAWDAALAQVLALSSRELPTMHRIRLLLYRSQAVYMGGATDAARALAAEALRLAEIEGAQGLVAEALHRLGVSDLLRDDLPAARTHLEQAYHLGHGHQTERERGNISLNLGTIAMQQGDLTTAERCILAACRHYQSAGEPVALAKAQCNLAEVFRRTGQGDAAMPLLLAARELFRSAAAHYDYGLVLNDLGCLYLTLEQWESALEVLSAAVAEFKRIGSLNGQAFVLSNLAELYVTTGQWEAAVPTLAEAERLAWACDRPLIAAAVAVDRGRMFAVRGQPVEARRVWEAALTIQEGKRAGLAAEHTRSLLATLAVAAVADAH